LPKYDAWLLIGTRQDFIVNDINPLTPTVAIWLQLYKASCARPG